MDVLLVHPEIAGNTGNMIRLCANTNSRLHLVKPLGFDLDDKRLKRSGLDYHDMAVVTVHETFEAATSVLVASSPKRRFFAFSSSSKVVYSSVEFRNDDVLVFGCESAGLTQSHKEFFPVEHNLVLPMVPGNRSLNLANSVAIVVFEAWRQNNFAGASFGRDVAGSNLANGLNQSDLAQQSALEQYDLAPNELIQGLTSESLTSAAFDL